MGNSAQDSQMAWEFGEAFLDQFAGRIISDPSVALVELVANAFDAGAWQVSIIWPSDPYGYFAIEDNGVGMTTAQFEHRWRSWSYNRVREQGANIEYPANFPGPKLPRAAFGRNGQGRLGAFCFSSEYRIETWRDGECTIAQVTRSDATDQPFGYQILEVSRREGHGTIISTNAIKPESYIPESAVLNSVGSKFVVVPWLDILVNNSQVGLTDLSGLTTTSLNIPGMGEQIRIHTVEADRRDRTIALRGIAWWVNGRMVGEPSWGRFTHEGAFLDGRRQLAGSCSFIVEADVLKTDVKSDWTWFHDTPQSLAVEHAVDAFVSEKLRQFDGKRRKARKSAAVHESRQALRSMTSGRRLWVGRFIDAIMDQ
jgi:hypothetical protein